MMRKILLLILLLVTLATQAEMVKKGTVGLKTIGGEAILLFNDSANVYPYEPVAENGWRLVMWVGYVDTGSINSSNLIGKGSLLLDMKSFAPCSKMLVSMPLPYLEDFFAGTYRHLKKFALYLYIPDTAIIESSRMEHRFEEIVYAKKKNQWALFQKFKTDFGFIEAPLTQPYTMYFVYDERSPQGRNDYRMMIFTDTAKQIIAVANDGYRTMKLKEKSKGVLDRSCTIFYLVNLPEEERKRIQDTFVEAYRFRDK